jgi:hypothetical protein
MAGVGAPFVAQSILGLQRVLSLHFAVAMQQRRDPRIRSALLDTSVVLAVVAQEGFHEMALAMGMLAVHPTLCVALPVDHVVHFVVTHPELRLVLDVDVWLSSFRCAITIVGVAAWQSVLFLEVHIAINVRTSECAVVVLLFCIWMRLAWAWATACLSHVFQSPCYLDSAKGEIHFCCELFVVHARPGDRIVARRWPQSPGGKPGTQDG